MIKEVILKCVIKELTYLRIARVSCKCDNRGKTCFRIDGIFIIIISTGSAGELEGFREIVGDGERDSERPRAVSGVCRVEDRGLCAVQ